MEKIAAKNIRDIFPVYADGYILSNDRLSIMFVNDGKSEVIGMRFTVRRFDDTGHETGAIDFSLDNLIISPNEKYIADITVNECASVRVEVNSVLTRECEFVNGDEIDITRGVRHIYGNYKEGYSAKPKLKKNLICILAITFALFIVAFGAVVMSGVFAPQPEGGACFTRLS